MLTLDATASARIATSVRGACWLVEMDFTTGTLRYTTWPTNVDSGGQTYIGTGGNVSIDNVSESQDSANDKVTISFPIIATSLIAASMGNVDAYRGRSIRIYLQLMDETYQPAGAKVLRWAGHMQPVKISRKPAKPDGGVGTGRIELPCTRAGMSRARNQSGLRLTDAQQKARYPGDRLFERTQALVERPTPWVSIAFQRV